MKRNRRSIYGITTHFDDNGGAGSGDGGAGGGGGTPPATPPAGITEDRVKSIVADALKPLRADFTKTISETFMPVTEKLDGFAEILKALQPQPSSKREGGETTPDPQMVARLMEQERQAKALNEQVQRLTKENEQAKVDAERSDRASRIRAALGQFQFVSEDAAETAFNLMERAIRRDSETGNLIGGPDGQALPFDIYIKETLNSKHAYLLGTKYAGGSGATRGDSKLGTSGVMVGTTEMIRPGMRNEERAAVIQQIQHVASQMTR